MTVIDSQCHWFSRTMWEAYTERDAYPRCRRDGDGYAYELAPGRWFPIAPHFYELELQLEAADAAGIDVLVSSSASFGDVDGLPVPRAIELAHELNEERAAAQREHEGRFHGLASVPWQNAEAAIEVLDRAAELGLPGVLLHSNVDGAPVDADERRAIFARVAELGLVVSIHPARTIAEERWREYGLEYLVGFMFDTSLAALRLVLSGIMEDNPDLRVVHPHCGATLPYLAGRIDASHDKPYSLGEALPTPPSAQLGRFYTDTVCQSPKTLAFALEFYEDGHVMFGSDYPFFDPAEELAFARDATDGDEGVLAGNAAELFGIARS
jgi:aminocarboxymuconate-semialdehyde decarboxylase